MQPRAAGFFRPLLLFGIVISGTCLKVHHVSGRGGRDGLEYADAVAGVPHPDLGDAVTAFLILDGEFSEAAVDQYLQSRIANYKKPKKYVNVDSLPRNAMGKIQRAKLREEYSTLFFDAEDHN